MYPTFANKEHVFCQKIDMNKRLHVIIHGIVQGVNFRYATRRMARSSLLMGWVRNKPNGTVEVLVEGPLPHLETFIAFLRTGPPAACVNQLDLTWHEATGEFVAFDIM